MTLSIIIVSWNVKDYLRQCLQSIHEQTHDIDYEIIVVDNASHDGSAEMVRNDFPNVRLLVNVCNVGFARANNQGAEIAEGDWLCFLNDDIQLIENSLAIMLKRIQNNSHIGLLGCRLLFPDYSPQESVRRFPTLYDQLFILLKLHHFFPNHPLMQDYYMQNMEYKIEQEVDQVMGACMMMATSDFKKLQGFDEHFFLWFEEVDLQKRVRDLLQKSVMYTPCTTMIHAKSVSFNKVQSVTRQRRFNQSMQWYFRKHHGRRSAMIIGMVHPLSMLLAMMVTLGRLWKKPNHNFQ